MQQVREKSNISLDSIKLEHRGTSAASQGNTAQSKLATRRQAIRYQRAGVPSAGVALLPQDNRAVPNWATRKQQEQ